MKYTIVLLIIIFSFISCKYEDGPAISLRSAEKRIEGNYEIDKFEVGGIDSTTAIRTKPCYGRIGFNYKDKNGTLGIGYGIGCKTYGRWSLRSSNSKIYIEFLGAFSGIGPFGSNNMQGYNSAVWDILRLKDDEMILTTTYQGIHYKITLTE